MGEIQNRSVDVDQYAVAGRENPVWSPEIRALKWWDLPMDDELKKNIKNVTEKTEIKLTESILRWKYKKEGKKIPVDQDLEVQSRQILEQAHKTILKRGKNIWNELKKAYQNKRAKEE